MRKSRTQHSKAINPLDENEKAYAHLDALDKPVIKFAGFCLCRAGQG